LSPRAATPTGPLKRQESGSNQRPNSFLTVDVKPISGDDTKEMLNMNHEAVLRVEVDYRQRRFLDEAEADRVAKQVRNAK
jgi:hypothetical protein